MIGTLSRAYQTLNKGLFEEELDDVEFHTNLTRKCIFYHSSPSELEIGSAFPEASAMDVLDDLLHAMIHILHQKQGIQDYTPNQYHKREFCEQALKLGLVVVCHPRRGWGLTFSDPSHKDVVSADKVRLPDDEAVRLRAKVYRRIRFPTEELRSFKRQLRQERDAKPHKEYQLKYVCECDPPFIIRSGRRPSGPRPLSVTCDYCKAKFVLDGGSEVAS